MNGYVPELCLLQGMRHFSQVSCGSVLGGKIVVGPLHRVLRQIQHLGGVLRRDLMLPRVKEMVQLVKRNAEEELLIADGKTERVRNPGTS